MGYTFKNAKEDFFNYLGISPESVTYVPNSKDFGIELINPDTNEKCVVFISAVGRNTSSPKMYFDTRDSYPKERIITRNYAKENNLKFFFLGVRNEEDCKIKDFFISLEANESQIQSNSGKVSANSTERGGNQVNLPSTFTYTKKTERLKSDKGFFFSAIHKENLWDYMTYFDNRPYEENAILDNENISKNIEKSLNRIIFGAPGTGKSYKLNHESQVFKSQEITFVRDSSIETKIKNELIDCKTKDIDSMPQYAYEVKIGGKYSHYLCNLINSGVGGQEFKNLFEITNSADYMKYGALANRTKDYSEFIERVTFHPNYSYAQFVGTYKPIQDRENKDNIRYEYIPGPFMRIYVNAKRNPEKNFLLLIEEINRANVAAVFGDVFQLLDRQSDGTSQYPIAASEDQKNYLESCGISEVEISIPSNMYIWATMNSADQGVLPMDAAFKRRWDFEYIGIDDNEDSIKDYVLPIPHKDSDGNISYTSENWNKIRHAINDKLKNIYGVNEDKLLGPYFLSKSTLDEAKQINCETETDKAEKICSLFKSKVLMYLYEDVVKMNPTELFNKSVFSEDKPLHYSDLCNKFDELGLKIFDEDFIK